MSLVRLLTAGRSLVGGSNSEPHYRMTNPKAMPKFVSRKNPFRSEVRPGHVSVDTSYPVVATAPAPVSAPVVQPNLAPVPAPSAPPAAVAPGRVRLAMAGLKERTAKFFAWMAHPRPAATKPAVPRFEPLPIQGELSLDRIKVVRNDLSDADLELVPRAPAAPAKVSASPVPKTQPELVPVSESAPAPAPKLGAARMALNRAGRLLGAVKG